MRLFTAISVQDIQFEADDTLDSLEFKWIPQQNYHITLSFLGEVSEDHLPQLMQVLDRLAQRHSGFSLSLSGLGAFPSMEQGKMLWVGVEDSPELRSLQADGVHSLQMAGLQLEHRPFRPHLTLARRKTPCDLREALSLHSERVFGSLKVKQFELFASTLGDSFPVYTSLKAFSLNEAER